jgi:hypothetical protein
MVGLAFEWLADRASFEPLIGAAIALLLDLSVLLLQIREQRRPGYAPAHHDPPND